MTGQNIQHTGMDRPFAIFYIRKLGKLDTMLKGT